MFLAATTASLPFRPARRTYGCYVVAKNGVPDCECFGSFGVPVDRLIGNLSAAFFCESMEFIQDSSPNSEALISIVVPSATTSLSSQ